MSPQACRRDRLDGLKAEPTTHAGLWLDKYMSAILRTDESPRDTDDPRQSLVEAVASRSTPPLYAHFYQRWRATLGALGAHVKEARAVGRIVLGIGNEGVLETAITLHRTYGVPYLPGSALKGLAASYASQWLGGEWREGGRGYLTLFGNTQQAGYFTFFDAYPIVPQGRLLHADIMAIHHPDYYQQRNKPPADWDNPSLVPFLSATGSYLLALAGPDVWVNAAFQILTHALRDMGIGAKTSSGYGRMEVADERTTISSAPGGHVVRATSVGGQAIGQPQGESYAVARKRLLKEQPAAGRMRGVVKTVKTGYGFIGAADGGRDVYVHETQLRERGTKLREEQVLEFSVETTPKGRNAHDVVILLEPGR